MANSDDANRLPTSQTGISLKEIEKEAGAQQAFQRLMDRTIERQGAAVFVSVRETRPRPSILLTGKVKVTAVSAVGNEGGFV